MDEILAFPGVHSDHFARYIRYKRSLGYEIGAAYQYVLKEVATVIDAHDSHSNIISRPVMEELTARKPGEAVATQCQRITVLRQFGIWLTSQGYAPEIPAEGLVRRTTNFVPRIVTEPEMARILDVADRTDSESRRLLLRLLWCTGMRLGEACRLSLRHLDLHNGTILVEHAKGDRTRLLPMSPSLWDYTEGYVKRCGLTSVDGAFPLLPTMRGNHPNRASAGQLLTKVFAQANVLTNRGTPIRPHDLRHSFAVRSLEKMVAAGKDTYVTLPLLATFMGHADVQSTEYYLRFTEETLLRIIDTQEPTSQQVFGGAL